MILVTGCNNGKTQITITSEVESPKIQFAIDEINAAIAERESRVNTPEAKNAAILFTLQSENSDIKTEGFRIKKMATRLELWHLMRPEQCTED